MILKLIIRKILNQLKHISVLFTKYQNRFKFWLYEVEYGKDISVLGKISIRKNKDANFVLGNNVCISSGKHINPLCRNIESSFYLPLPTSQLYIGDCSGLSSPCIWVKEKITIGKRVKIGGDCILMDTDAHNLNYQIRSSSEKVGKYYKDKYTAKSAPILIEDDVLIGTRCIILKGVTIGARSIIAAGSVVTKSIPSDCIAGGNPAKVIRNLNQ